MPCVLIVADQSALAPLERELSEPFAAGPIEIAVGTGGDETVDLFRACRPEVVVVATVLEQGDSHALIAALRELAPVGELAVVIVGGDDLRPRDDTLAAPDETLAWPFPENALRTAVERGFERVRRLRERPVTISPSAAPDRAAQRARWAALADSIERASEEEQEGDEPASAPPVVVQPKRVREHRWEAESPVREPTLILREEPRTVESLPAVPATASRLEDDPLILDLDFAQELRLGPDEVTPRPHVPARGTDPAQLAAIEDDLVAEPVAVGSDGPDFARQLRAKMSIMAQRLFRTDHGTGRDLDVAPHHDHQTEIDLAALAEEPALGGVTEIEARARALEAQPPTAPGSWDTQVRERGLPDSGEIVRGVSDAAQLLAKAYAQQTTGRLSFRRTDVEKIVFFDQGRPVFASSSDRGDRMGELLVREGKITASQYERCQGIATTSGRRMGEILVDVGYLKRRELLPAVRRHVEDIIFSMFGWSNGHYRIMVDTAPSAERIRLSRHAASLILEGVRRKLDRTALEALIGPPSTVVEVRDRERLGGIITLGDLAPDERTALNGFDGQADLAQVARTAGIDLADLLPLAWGLCVLGLATARRNELEAPDESTALVGETDLAIDRERVRARWQLVTEADYFALLGVRRDATGFEIRRAYQAARRDFAADCFPSDLRRELALELDDIANVLDEAFRVLRDDRLRNTYLSNLIE